MALFNNTFKAAVLFAVLSFAVYGTGGVWSPTAAARSAVSGYREEALTMLKKQQAGGGSSL